MYDWALVDTTDPAGPDDRPKQILIRRSRSGRQELAFFVTHSPRPVSLGTLVTVAGRRWEIEECFQSGKNEVGLDHYQVRLYHAWYRHITLAMLAHAWLTVTATKHREQHPPAVPPTMTAVGYKRLPGGLPVAAQPEPDRHMRTPFTLNEIRHVFALFTEAVLPPSMITWWSDWRRGHQAHARYYHYQTRIHAAQGIARQAATTQRSLVL